MVHIKIFRTFSPYIFHSLNMLSSQCWDWEQSSLVLNTPTKKVRDSFASSMIKEDNRVGSCIGDLYLIPEQ